MWTSFKLYQISIYSSEQTTLSEHLLLLWLSLLSNYQMQFEKIPTSSYSYFSSFTTVRSLSWFFNRSNSYIHFQVHQRFSEGVFYHVTTFTGQQSSNKNGNVIFVRWIYLRIDCTPDHQLKSLPYDTFLFIICNWFWLTFHSTTQPSRSLSNKFKIKHLLAHCTKHNKADPHNKLTDWPPLRSLCLKADLFQTSSKSSLP